MKLILMPLALSNVAENILIAAGCALVCGLVEIGLELLRRLFGLEKQREER